MPRSEHVERTRNVTTQTAGMSVLLLAMVASGAPAQGPSMDGVWRSQGYGNVFDIHGPTLNAFEVTNTTCVAGGGADHKLLHSEGSASDERIDRIPRLPAVCDHPTENTPAGNFEVFAQTW